MILHGLVESSAGFFLFTKLSAQADDIFQRKSSSVFQLPVFPKCCVCRASDQH